MKIALFILIFTMMAFPQQIASIDTTYGDELITNGAFDSDLTGWSEIGTPTLLEWVASGGGFTGAVHVTGDGINDGVAQASISLTSGNIYHLKTSLNRIITASIRGVVFTSQYEPQVYDFAEGVTHIDTVFTCMVTDPLTICWLFNSGTGVSEFYVDNISLRQVISIDTTYETTADGKFKGSSGWNKFKGF